MQEGRGGVDRVEAITASELRELVLRALIEMDEGDDMCRSIAVARRAATPWAAVDAHFAVVIDTHDGLVVIEETHTRDELTPQTAMRALTRTADPEEDQGTTIQLGDRSMDLEHVLRCDGHTVGDHDQAVDEEECRGVIEQDI